MHSKRKLIRFILVIIVAVGIASIAWQAQICVSRKTAGGSSHRSFSTAKSFTEAYPYGGKQFDQLIIESYNYRGSSEWRSFYSQMERAYKNHRASFSDWNIAELNGMLDSERHKLNAMKNGSKRARNEMALSADLHRFIKTAIPKFSLDRGFEFYYTNKFSERQCFLQSVLIAGMLQRAGVAAGIAMVYKNTTGDETNNGHAVVLVRLSNGRDIMVDASEQKPFARQKGLFIRESRYAYIDPVFSTQSNEILRYRSPSTGKAIERSKVSTLDYDFIRSQFWYYRGERATGGLLLLPKTANGLKASEDALRTSVEICPENPLAVFTLGRVYMAEGKSREAKEAILDASKLYSRFGWMPSGVKEYLALIKAPNAG